jgi:hypothetical protein
MVIIVCVPWDFLDPDAKRTKTIVVIIPAEMEALAVMVSTRTPVNVRLVSKEKTVEIKYQDAKVVRAETVQHVMMKEIPTNALVQPGTRAINVRRSLPIVTQSPVKTAGNV